MTSEHPVVPTDDFTPDIFRERDPQRAIARYSEIAQAVGTLIKNQELYVVIGGRKHVRIEGWQALGAPLGIFAEVERSERIRDGDRWGYEASAIAHRLTGEDVSAADAECWSDEQNWQNRPDFQIRSMAQTRACAKALRLALGFVMAMAGYEATPAEEMEPEQAKRKPTMPQGKKVPVAKRQPAKAQADGPNYSAFWTTIHKDLGMQPGDVHALLNEASLKDWVAAGKTLDEALAICKDFVGEYNELLKQGWGEPEALADVRRRHFGEKEEQEAYD